MTDPRPPEHTDRGIDLHHEWLRVGETYRRMRPCTLDELLDTVTGDETVQVAIADGGER